MPDSPVKTLMVEDSESDARLAQIALQRTELFHDIDIVRDGKAALEYLRNEGEYADASRPDIVLLDLNLPKLNGHEVLEEIRNDPELRSLPVVILTTSDSQIDVQRSYDSFASCYITKPVDLSDFMDVVKSIEQFWMRTARLPSKA